MVNVTAIIQARTGSTRLPNKVLSNIENKPLIWHVINRTKKSKSLHQVVLATTRKRSDLKLIQIAKKSGVLFFKGSSDDVLERYYQCAVKFQADPIVRITGDCPLIDHMLIDKMVKFFLTKNYDYVSNRIPPTYPDGLDIEIFSFKALEKTYHSAKLLSEREHVTPYVVKHPKIFKICNYANPVNYSNLRWTVDEDKDLRFVRAIYRKMKPKLIFSMNDIITLISRNPKLLDINSDILRDEGYRMSFKFDKKIN